MAQWTLQELKDEIRANERCIRVLREFMEDPSRYPGLGVNYKPSDCPSEIHLREKNIAFLEGLVRGLAASIPDEIGPSPVPWGGRDGDDGPKRRPHRYECLSRYNAATSSILSRPAPRAGRRPPGAPVEMCKCTSGDVQMHLWGCAPT